jgi:hypothetical protein
MALKEHIYLMKRVFIVNNIVMKIAFFYLNTSSAGCKKSQAGASPRPIVREIFF